VSSHADEYARHLSTLHRDAFEDEVCDRLRSVYTDFQRVPRKPSGDAGLDGLSHDQTRAYCCYGPDFDPVKLDGKGLKEDILEKFRGDLRKLCEVAHQGKTKLVQKPGALGQVLGKSSQIMHVFCCVNWFEDKRILGSLISSFRTFKTASTCSFVSSRATVTVWGPKDLAGLASVDDVARFRAENRLLVSKLAAAQQQVSAPIPQTVLKDFDAKFDWLVSQEPSKAIRINATRDMFRAAWSKALFLDQQLESVAPRLHEALQTAREHAALRAQLRSLQNLSHGQLLEKAYADVSDHLRVAFNDGGLVSDNIAGGEVARLVGECPIDWR
jgi:hypothetical protein